jgi:hypothetical protein
MNCIQRTLGFLFFFSVLLSLSPAESNTTPKNELAPPLAIQIEVAQPDPRDSSMPVLINLQNRSASEEIKSVRIEVWEQNLKRGEREFDTLEPGRVVSAKFEVPRTASDMYFSATYTWREQQHTVLQAIDRAPMSKPDSMWPVLLPAIGTLVGGIFGAWLINLFTEHREQARARFEWSKMLFEKYEKGYRDFLRNWQGSTNRVVLETQFAALQENSLVPRAITELYKNTVSTLENAASGDEEKERSCSALQQAIDRFLQEPWYFAPR